MVKNMGSADRIIRVILGVAGIILAIVFGGWVWVAGGLGIVFLLTSTISFCPIYAPFKISTRRTADESSP
jgi:hypothetical protein